MCTADTPGHVPPANTLTIWSDETSDREGMIQGQFPKEEEEEEEEKKRNPKT